MENGGTAEDQWYIDMGRRISQTLQVLADVMNELLDRRAADHLLASVPTPQLLGNIPDGYLERVDLGLQRLLPET